MTRSINIVTDVPGPRSIELCRRSSASIARPLVPGGDIFVEKGSGAVLTDVDGNSYIDFIGGVGCLTTGHSHPKVTAAVEAQIASFLHTDFSLVPYESYVRLAEQLSDLTGGGRKVGFFNSGAEAVENAVKVAKAGTGRQGIVCFEGAFHGRTLMALTLTSREEPYKKGFGPFPGEVYRARYPGFEGASLADAVQDVKQIFAEHPIAGLIVEPVLGEGGFIAPPIEFLQQMSSLCAKDGAALIVDEVQSGFGRTGTFLASEQSGVRPSVVILGKSIAAGLPLSAVLGDPEWMDAPVPNGLGGTFVGNPVACAAALAVLDVIKDEGLVERARKIGATLTSRWSDLAERSGAISEVRGLGSMVGVEFTSTDVASDVLRRARRAGVLAITAGRQAKTIRHLMPLVITDEQLDEAFEVFDEAVMTRQR